MTKKFDSFKQALAELCRAHAVSINPGGYDFIRVWDLDPDHPSDLDDALELLVDRTDGRDNYDQTDTTVSSA